MFAKVFPPEDVTALFSDRTMDFVLPPGAAGLTTEQRRHLARFARDPLEKVATIRQVHGAVVLTAPWEAPSGAPLPEADALVTRVPGVALTIRTADCLPIFLYDPVRHCIALVHAGWRGTREGIAEAALAAMSSLADSRPADVVAAFGPCIRPCCYAVGPEFRRDFPLETVGRAGQWFLDLAAVNRRQLTACGVTENHIHDSGVCTCCEDRFFSYRREGGWAGRHLSLLMLKTQAVRG